MSKFFASISEKRRDCARSPVVNATKTALVMGAGGFIGHHLVKRLKADGYWVVGVDLKNPSFESTYADEFILGDCSHQEFMSKIVFGGRQIDEVYQLAADMGGAGYIFSGANDFNVMANSSGINITLCAILAERVRMGQSLPRVFYSSSACIYPEEIQLSTEAVDLREENAYPANPDSEYGWEKLFSERLFLALHRNYGVDVKVARFHNIYGPLGTWSGGKEKAPAAICRKVAQADNGGEIEIWGDGKQTRSFLYIEDCIEAVRRLMSKRDFFGPINIGSEEMVSINELVAITAKVAGKNVTIRSVDGPTGVRGRNSNNELIRSTLHWDYTWTLEDGIRSTYSWISDQVLRQTPLP
jgi:nucleoside-diphosphate-sugar epimerase